MVAPRGEVCPWSDLVVPDDSWGGLLTLSARWKQMQSPAHFCGTCETLSWIELLRKAFQLLAFFLMHFVCVYTTGGNMWLLLKYDLHGFAEEGEKRTIQDFSRDKPRSVAMVRGLCVCPPQTPGQTRSLVWILLLDLPKPLKGCWTWQLEVGKHDLERYLFTLFVLLVLTRKLGLGHLSERAAWSKLRNQTLRSAQELIPVFLRNR